MPATSSPDFNQERHIPGRASSAGSAGWGISKLFRFSPDTNQLGRRNLSPEQMSLLRGRIYNRSKKTSAEVAVSGAESRWDAKDQNDPQHKQSTAEALAEKHGVSAPTIKRDGDRRSEESKGQNVPLKSTAEQLAEKHGVSDKTIKRDGQFAASVEALKEFPTISSCVRVFMCYCVPVFNERQHNESQDHRARTVRPH